tara:strand:+ start:5256 stop:6167 length:912 start_codon:yes stop_codon:yes gene_type:complete
VKVYIEYGTTENPYGGANQFIKALKESFIKKNIYTDDSTAANIILFNGHHHAMAVQELNYAKRKEQRFVHRLDGLQKIYNNPDDRRQDLAFHLNLLYADGTVFQSEWAKEKHIEHGLRITKHAEVIPNAPDDKIFNTEYTKEANKKTKLICSSFAPNPRKGFDIYNFLDKNLDFEKYEMMFVGNMAPGYNFENIRMLEPVRSKDLAEILKNQDIYVTAVKDDCCSNSLIEALSCGLPSVVLNSGGSPEIVKDGGVLFEGEEDILERIEELSSNIEKYRNSIKTSSINEISDEYISFFERVANG